MRRRFTKYPSNYIKASEDNLGKFLIVAPAKDNECWISHFNPQYPMWDFEDYDRLEGHIFDIFNQGDANKIDTEGSGENFYFKGPMMLKDMFIEVLDRVGVNYKIIR